MTRIIVADLGTGNLRSVSKALEHVAPKASVVISARPNDIRTADRLVLPGQGAIGTWMQSLSDDSLSSAIHFAIKTRPVLGICLGLEALYERSSEDGGQQCLGVLPGVVQHFSEIVTDPADKIPHMGWNRVRQVMTHPLWNGIDDGERFYFVHSYHVHGADQKQIAGETVYGAPFTSAAAHENIFATQFHPEKSAGAGLRLLANFVSWSAS